MTMAIFVKEQARTLLKKKKRSITINRQCLQEYIIRIYNICPQICIYVTSLKRCIFSRYFSSNSEWPSLSYATLHLRLVHCITLTRRGDAWRLLETEADEEGHW